MTKLQGVCSNCHPQLDWRCSDTTCINNTQVCDGREDCSDGGDEQFCNFICYDMQTIDMEVGQLLDFVDTKPELHRKFAIKFLTVLKARMRIIARFVCIAMASFLYLLSKVKVEEMIVNYDGQESGDYEEEDNGGTFGSWDLW